MTVPLQQTAALLIVVALVVALGCDAQVDTDYVGDPVAQIVGTIRSEMKSAPTDASAGLVWFNRLDSENQPEFLTGERVPVAAQFPARFSIGLYSPPPDKMLNDFTNGGRYPDESRIGMALIVVGSSALIASDAQQAFDGTYGGLAENHVLAYLPAEVKAGTYSEAYLHGRLGAGFHVLEIRRQSDAEVFEIERCQLAASTTKEELACGIAAKELYYAAPRGLRTSIPVRLVDDASQLTPPDIK